LGHVFRLADDAKVGRALVVGPWLAGAWWARVQYEKPCPPTPTEIRGRYRTVGLLPYAAGVRADFYDAGGKRLNRVEYSLLPAANWTPFSVRFDKFPVRTARMEFSFGLGQHTQGEVWFAQLEKRPAGPHPLADLPAPKLTRSAPPGQQKGTGFWRVERFDETWWLIDPEGRPSYSRATAPPNPPATWKEALAAADKYVGELRDWGFDGLAGWHSLRLHALYNRELRKQGRPTIPQFAVLNYHDCFKHGEYDVLTDRHGRQKSGEHGFPDPYHRRMERAGAGQRLVRTEEGGSRLVVSRCGSDPGHRARQAAQITADFFNEPQLVGAHWFIYGDFDSADREANRGLVRSDGQPWDELVRELKAVHRDIQDHLRSGPPAAHRPRSRAGATDSARRPESPASAR
jgi:hypothetical protein